MPFGNIEETIQKNIAAFQKPEENHEHAVRMLVMVGKPAVPALLNALRMSNSTYLQGMNVSYDFSETAIRNRIEYRKRIAEALGYIGGAGAIMMFLDILSDPADKSLHLSTLQSLHEIGDPSEIPLKVVAEEDLTPSFKFELLERLKTFNWKWKSIVPPLLRPSSSKPVYTSIRFNIPDVEQYCRDLMDHPRPKVRKGAKQIIESRTLLRASQDTDNLLRPAGFTGSDPDTLLRPSDKDE